MTDVTVQFSLGTYTKSANFKLTPNYSEPSPMKAQVQPLSWREIMMLDGLQLQGSRFGIYMNGSPQGLVRLTQKGGDLITFINAAYGFPAGSIFLTALVLEAWPEWAKVAATLQNGS